MIPLKPNCEKSLARRQALIQIRDWITKQIDKHADTATTLAILERKVKAVK